MEAVPITLKARNKRELVEKLRFGASLNCEVRYTLDPAHARLLADAFEAVLNVDERFDQRAAELARMSAELQPKMNKQIAVLALQVVLVAALWASLIWGTA